MIIDTPGNLHHYAALNARLGAVARYLAAHDLRAMPNGKYNIDGEDLFFTLLAAPLRDAADAPLEVHDAYIDVQVIVEGTEGFGWRDRTACEEPRGVMDRERDILFFGDTHSLVVEVPRGCCAVFFPADAHAPLIGRGQVRKAIFKVRV